MVRFSPEFVLCSALLEKEESETTVFALLQFFSPNLKITLANYNEICYYIEAVKNRALRKHTVIRVWRSW